MSEIGPTAIRGIGVVGFWTIFIIIVVGAIAAGIIQAMVGSATKKSALEKISSRFPLAKLHAHEDGSYLAIDIPSKTIVVGRVKATLDGPQYEATYDFGQIAKVDLSVDGNSLTSTNRGSQVLGAAVGAVALGGVGAVIGGLSGSSRTSNNVRKIAVNIIADDDAKPFHSVTFMKAVDQKKGNAPTSIVVTQPMKQGEEFNALLVNAIRTAEREKQVAHAPAPLQAQSVSGQLKDLWDLKEMGVLTLEEFESQKRAVLAASSSSELRALPPS